MIQYHLVLHPTMTQTQLSCVSLTQAWSLQVTRSTGTHTVLSVIMSPQTVLSVSSWREEDWDSLASSSHTLLQSCLILMVLMGNRLELLTSVLMERFGIHLPKNVETSFVERKAMYL